MSLLGVRQRKLSGAIHVVWGVKLKICFGFVGSLWFYLYLCRLKNMLT